ncbi:hypothetical protein CYLTODRAFT_101672 [Cylindrobasidium torrendii FP15055 ss-10]|uniref:Uncharacterized protein n=1 Tax=Cylindrobasidium torrendii FP15055 ss-10 TaxID=1314674 RepID=A0A0D7B1D3_9AGAR|nr:hypothetical protein CYLTODRAFT_101672 [Cylindrobasidium torrendii FP15055 ss-10]
MLFNAEASTAQPPFGREHTYTYNAPEVYMNERTRKGTFPHYSTTTSSLCRFFHPSSHTSRAPWPTLFLSAGLWEGLPAQLSVGIETRHARFVQSTHYPVEY